MSVARITELLEPIYVIPANQTTTNSFVDVAGGIIDTADKSNIVYTLLNAHAANSINWQVLMSVDGVTYVEAQADATIAALGVGTYVASATALAYRYFKVQVKSTVGGAHGTADLSGYAKF